MTDQYFSAKELAGVAGMPGTDRAVQLKAKREKLPFRRRVGRGGGREYPLSCLPMETQIALRMENAPLAIPALSGNLPIYKGNIAKGVPSPLGRTEDRGSRSEKGGENTGNLPVPINGDAQKQLIALPNWARNTALDRLAIVNQAKKITGKQGATEMLRRLAAEKEISLSTLYNYIRTADDAALAAKTAQTDALTHQILAMSPDHGKTKGQIRSFSPAAVEYAISIYANQAHLNLSDVYTQTVNEGRINGWKIGSDDSLKRIIDQRMSPSLQTLARQGWRRYEADCSLKILRDYRDIWPNMMWCGDHHIFDVFVSFGNKVLRPWLTTWLDMRSRSFMGWCISFKPCGQTIAMALAHAISPKNDDRFPQCGLPGSVYIDNGKDYRSKYLNGEEIPIGQVDYPAVIERFAAMGIDPYYIDLEYDHETKSWVKKRGQENLTIKSIRVGGVFSRLKIHQRYATAYHPWAKPIERAFRDVVQQFSRIQPGWCGSGHEQRPDKLTWEIKRGLILDITEFSNRWYDWAVDRNNKPGHTGHGMDGHSPTEIWTSLCTNPEPVAPETLAFALTKKEQVKIHSWGFHLLGHQFELDLPSSMEGAAILNRIINRFVTVFYDWDLKTILIFIGEEFICRGRALQRASFVKENDPVMVDKLKLAAYQNRINKGELRLIEGTADAGAGQTLSELLIESDGSQPGAAVPQGLLGPQGEESQPRQGGAGPQEEEIIFGIALTADERYRQILFRLAHRKTLGQEDVEFKAEFEAGREYLFNPALYEAEFEMMKYQAGKGTR
jgi:hypothetical protein